MIATKANGWGKQPPPMGTPLDKGGRFGAGLLSYFDYGAGAGPTVTDLVTGRDAALGTGFTWSDGPDGPALTFGSGIPDFAPGIGSYPGWDVALPQISILALVRPAGSGYRGMISGGPEFRVDAGGTLSLLRAGVANLGTSTEVVANGVWAWVGAAYNGASVRFFVDGRPAGANSASGTFAAGKPLPGAGDGGWSGGQQARMVVWGHALADEDFASLYAEPFQMFPTPAPWRFYSLPAAPIITSFGSRATSGARLTRQVR